MDEARQGTADKLIRNVFRYMDKNARDIMTHRKNIVAIDEEESLEDALHFGVVLLHHLDHFGDLFRSDLHGFFTDDGLPRIGSGNADLPMGAAGDADADHIHLGIL